ncbi:hypothetical protein [Streptomyces albidus (ex Kaewkla and Franco 2022)]|uniref:hypothetical protein n=1 Tax=Streptomyces albidus (ex Kaewkla and Franco 2022) TaxID=722709 RepID=UPI0015EFCCDB|nr:hypothetical protein [Streptomyces albidus (ex Kaewkla and Franco 2022)]
MSDNDGDRPRRADTRYMTGISIGMATGSVLGLLVFDNIALGMGVGLPIGIAIGMMGQPRRKRGASPSDDG